MGTFLEWFPTKVYRDPSDLPYELFAMIVQDCCAEYLFVSKKWRDLLVHDVLWLRKVDLNIVYTLCKTISYSNHYKPFKNSWNVLVQVIKNSKDQTKGQELLHSIVKDGNKKLLEFLLRHQSIDINIPTIGHYEIFSLQFEYPLLSQPNDFTVICIAAKYGMKDIFKLLHHYGATISQDAIQHILSQDNLELFEYVWLLGYISNDYQNDICGNCMDEGYNESCMYDYILKHEKLRILEYLLQNGMDANGCYGESNQLPLNITPYCESIKLLQKYGAILPKPPNYHSPSYCHLVEHFQGTVCNTCSYACRSYELFFKWALLWLIFLSIELLLMSLFHVNVQWVASFNVGFCLVMLSEMS